MSITKFQRAILVVLEMGAYDQPMTVSRIDACFREPIVPRQLLVEALVVLENLGLASLRRDGGIIVAAELTAEGRKATPAPDVWMASMLDWPEVGEP